MFLLINCHIAKLLKFVNSEGIVSLSKNTNPGFAPFLTSEYFKTRFLIWFFTLEGFLVFILIETAPLPRVFHGMLGLNRINRGKSRNSVFCF